MLRSNDFKSLFNASLSARHSAHRVLSRPDRPDYVFAFHDDEEIGPRMPARIAKHTGLKPEDL